MNKLIVRSAKWCFVLAAATLLAGSCSKDESPWLSLGEGAILVDGPGRTGTLEFTASGVQSISLAKVPEGWTITADMASMTLSATAPAELDGAGEAVQSGTATVTGHTVSGTTVTQKLYVSVVKVADLGAVQSNCFLVSQPNTNYSFDAMIKGENAGPIDTHEVRIIWQTVTELIQYPRLENGKFSFYAGADEDGGIKEGNALLGAYDAAGVLLWTWHIWMVDANDVKEQTYANGKTFMSLNLGALGNTNATQAEILESFGLFYQWGRKTPFVGPNTFDAAKGTDHTIYNASGVKVAIDYVKSDAATGTQSFAAANPLTYLLGVEESAYDWLFAEHPATLWSDAKTVNDPCPKGWRVPSKSDFAGLEIIDKAAGTVGQYGWTLTDGTAVAFYPGAGFRPYLNGKIQNVYNPVSGVEVPKPWMGYYWTAGTEGMQGAAMTFWFDAADAEQSGIQSPVSYHRADGMQVRCVKE